MLWATTLADIQSRYAGSVLGMFWLVIYPILMLTSMYSSSRSGWNRSPRRSM